MKSKFTPVVPHSGSGYENQKNNFILVSKKIFFICSVILLVSCQDVVKVDLDTAPPKLVIDASINWEKGTAGNLQTIKLSTTTGFYSNVIPSVSGAIIFITNSANTAFNFTEQVPNTGQYICNNFIPIIGETYVLTVNYAGQTYIATEKMIAVPDISNITQRNNAGFTANEIEVKFFFQDNGLENNSYLAKFITTVNAFPEYDAFDDHFTQGNEMFSLYSNKDLKTGNTINFTLYGVSTQYFNYMKILLGISGSTGGGPFQTPPATVRGNIVNQTNETNNCLGYFRLCEVDKLQYVVQ